MSQSLIESVEAGFQENGVEYKRREDNHLSVAIPGENVKEIEFDVWFPEAAPDYLSILSSSLDCHVDKERIREALELCNEMTGDYALVKFMLYDSGDVMVQFDSLADADSCCEAVVLGISAISAAIEESYPRFMALRWA